MNPEFGSFKKQTFYYYDGIRYEGGVMTVKAFTPNTDRGKMLRKWLYDVNIHHKSGITTIPVHVDDVPIAFAIKETLFYLPASNEDATPVVCTKNTFRNAMIYAVANEPYQFTSLAEINAIMSDLEQFSTFCYAGIAINGKIGNYTNVPVFLK